MSKQLKTCPLCEATSAGTAVRFQGSNPLCSWCDDEHTKRGLRWCRVCEQVKPIDCFSFAKAKTRRRMCKTCMRRQPYNIAAQQRWQKGHRPQINANARASYRRNLDHHRARNRACYHRHRTYYLARFARLRSEPSYRARHRAYVAANQARIRVTRQQRYLRIKLAILRGER